MHVAVTIVIVDGSDSAVDRKKVAVRAVVAMTGGVVVRHETPLEERIGHEGDAFDDF